MSSFKEHKEYYIHTELGNTLVEVESAYIEGSVVLTLLDSLN